MPSLAQDLSTTSAPHWVRGTSVWLRPPVDYEPAGSFTGFQNPDIGGYIMVGEIDGPYSQVIKGFEDSTALAKQGIVVISRESRPMGDAPGQLLCLAQAAGDVEVDKWAWCFGTDDRSVVIAAMCPKGAPRSHFNALSRALLSAEWDPGFAPDLLEGAAFSLLDTGGLELLGSAMGGFTYTLGGKPDETGKNPSFVVVPAIRPLEDGDRKRHAVRRLQESTRLTDFKLGTPLPIVVDGLEGYLTQARARFRGNQHPVSVCEVMLFKGTSYWLLRGQVTSSEETAWMPVFERRAKSFRRSTTSSWYPNPGGSS